MSIVREEEKKIIIEDNFHTTDQQELVFIKKASKWEFTGLDIFVIVIVVISTLIFIASPKVVANMFLDIIVIMLSIEVLIITKYNYKRSDTFRDSDKRMITITKLNKNEIYFLNDGDVSNFATIVYDITINETIVSTNEYRINYLKNGNSVNLEHSLEIGSAESFSISYKVIVYDRRCATCINVSQNMKLEGDDYQLVSNSIVARRISYNK